MYTNTKYTTLFDFHKIDTKENVSSKRNIIMYLLNPTLPPSLREQVTYPFGEFWCALTSIPMILFGITNVSIYHDYSSFIVLAMGCCSFLSHIYPIKLFHTIDLIAVFILVMSML